MKNKKAAVRRFYNEKGKEAAQLIKEAFALFIKSESAKAAK